MRRVARLPIPFLAAVAVLAQEPAIQLKTRRIDTAQQPVGLPQVGKRKTPGRSHYLVQYPSAPTPAQIQALRNLGALITGFVPETGLSISAPDDISFNGLGLRWYSRLEAADKLSPSIGAGAFQNLSSFSGGEVPVAFVVEFHPDVNPGAARSLAAEEGAEVQDRNGILSHHLLVTATREQAAKLTQWDEVAYVFPAAPELVSGNILYACPGGADEAALVGQYAVVSQGWRANAQGAQIGYRFGAMTPKIPATSAQTEIVRALQAWGGVAKVSFVPGVDPSAPQTMNIFFGAGAHGDSFPFDGPGKVLGHTFFPSPPNSESLAGDMHLDADENWGIGTGVDLFTVALHEAGHGLGLGHSDLPGAVMYPYYKLATTLSADDIAGIRSVYGASGTPTVGTGGNPPSGNPPSGNPPSGNPPSGNPPSGNPPSGNPPAGNPPNPSGSGTPPVSGDKTPPSIAITAPAGTIIGTAAAQIIVTGTASDNVAVTSVTWSNGPGATGSATGTKSWTASIPLLFGTNNVVVRARDAAGHSSWRSLTVVRR